MRTIGTTSVAKSATGSTKAMSYNDTECLTTGFEEFTDEAGVNSASEEAEPGQESNANAIADANTIANASSDASENANANETDPRAKIRRGITNGITNGNSCSSHSSRTINSSSGGGSNNNPNTNTSAKQNTTISEFDAIQHLIKGNLGPGCLNIPHAFALSGWVLGMGLFALVAVQGIYSMVLLVYCKQWIRRDRIRKRRARSLAAGGEESRDQVQDDNDNDNDEPIRTFMDVARASHGRAGSVCIQVLLFVLQAGVCCVFLSLIATNLHASLPHLPQEWCVCGVTVCLMVVVLLRDLRELRWLSLGANCLMLVAVLTASGSALWVLWKGDGGNENENDNDDTGDDPSGRAKKWTTDPAAIATFVSSMFYSFEGIGLVMPVENSYVGYFLGSNDDNDNNNENDDDDANHDHEALPAGAAGGEGHVPVASEEADGPPDPEEARRASRTASFVHPVLLVSMGTVAVLFLLIGATCGPAFPDILDGSVTAYLTTRYPNSKWYQLVNASVMLAVFLTFPLQLTPAMEVLEEWFGPGCDPVCCGGGESVAPCCCPGLRKARPGGRHAVVPQNDGIGRTDASSAGHGDGLFREGAPSAVAPPLPGLGPSGAVSCFGSGEWIFRRWLVVVGCALVVLTVDDLGLLVSLFGALGNTGLAAAPCIVHRRLVGDGIAPHHPCLAAMDACTVAVSLCVAVAGFVFSVREILAGKEPGR